MQSFDLMALDVELSRWAWAEDEPEWPWLPVARLGPDHPLGRRALQKAAAARPASGGRVREWIPVTALSPRWVASHLLDVTGGWNDLVARLRPLADRVVPLPQEAWLRMLASSFAFADDWLRFLDQALGPARAMSLAGVRERLPLDAFDVGGRGRPTPEALELILGALPGYSVISEAGLPAVLVEVTQVPAEEWRRALQELADAKRGEKDERASQQRLLELGHDAADLEDLRNRLPGPLQLVQPTCPDSVQKLYVAVPSRVMEKLHPYLGDLARILPALGESRELPVIDGQPMDPLTLHRYLEKALPTARRLLERSLRDILPAFHGWLKEAAPGDSARLLEVLSQNLSGDQTMAEAEALLQLAALAPPDGIKVQCREPVLSIHNGPGQTWLEDWSQPRNQRVPKAEIRVPVDEFYHQVTHEMFAPRLFQPLDPFWSKLEDVIMDEVATSAVAYLKVGSDESIRRLQGARKWLVGRDYLRYPPFRAIGERLAEILTHLREPIYIPSLLEDLCQQAGITKPEGPDHIRKMLTCLKLHPVREDGIPCRVVLPRQWHVARFHRADTPPALWICPADDLPKQERREWPNDRDRARLAETLARWASLPATPTAQTIDRRVVELWRRSIEAARSQSLELTKVPFASGRE